MFGSVYIVKLAGVNRYIFKLLCCLYSMEEKKPEWKEMDDDDFSGYRDTLEEAKKIKKAFSLESVDTAILLIIEQGIDQIRFHNSD